MATETDDRAVRALRDLIKALGSPIAKPYGLVYTINADDPKLKQARQVLQGLTAVGANHG